MSMTRPFLWLAALAVVLLASASAMLNDSSRLSTSIRSTPICSSSLRRSSAITAGGATERRVLWEPAVVVLERLATRWSDVVLLRFRRGLHLGNPLRSGLHDPRGLRLGHRLLELERPQQVPDRRQERLNRDEHKTTFRLHRARSIRPRIAILATTSCTIASTWPHRFNRTQQDLAEGPIPQRGDSGTVHGHSLHNVQQHDPPRQLRSFRCRHSRPDYKHSVSSMVRLKSSRRISTESRTTCSVRNLVSGFRIASVAGTRRRTSGSSLCRTGKC